MRVLVACEFSGVVRDAFRTRGHDAWSCDLLPTERPGPHIQGDVLDVLGDGWDLMIAHPPCTYLSRVSARWWRDPGREALGREALAFVLALYDAPIPRVAIENPIGRLNQWWRYPDQTIEPCHFGEPWFKRTCLWLRGLPPLLSSGVVVDARNWVDGAPFARVSRKRRFRGPAAIRRIARRTFRGVAEAMADQWGGVVEVAA